MQSQSRDQNGTAVTVITRAGDALNVDRAVDAAPEMDIIVLLEDVFPPVGEVSVAQQEAEAAEFEIFPVVAGNAVGHKCEANFIVPAMPTVAGVIRAQQKGLVDFGVGKR